MSHTPFRPAFRLGLAIIALTFFAGAAQAYAPPICPHILGWGMGIPEWAKGAPWIKALDISSCGRAKELGARVLYRVYDHASGPDGDTKIGGKKFGEEILERLSHLPKEMWPDAISFQNEFNDVSPQTAQCFIDMYDTLRAGGYKGLIVYGSYGPGGPTDKNEWERPHVKAAVMKADAVETHEYWDLTIKHYDTWLAHRHVRAMDMYPWLRGKPWFIGEFGSDAVNKGEDKENRSGWQDRGKLTASEFIKQIEIYRQGDPKEQIPSCADNVLGVFLFAQGASNWANYETMGTPVADYMKSTWKPTVGYIHGKVTDKAGKPVEGVRITVSGSKTAATSDAAGRYWLFALKPGSCKVTASKPGSTTQTVAAKVAAGEYVITDFVLSPER